MRKLKQYKGEFDDTIGISTNYKTIIKEIKGKKSMAGKLKEMIEFYLKEKGLWKKTKKGKND